MLANLQDCLKYQHIKDPQPYTCLVAFGRSPTIAAADATSPTSGVVTLNPPANTTSPVDYYTVKACPTTGGTCVTKNCTTAVCPIDALQPNTPYNVTAAAVINSTPVPASNTDGFITPLAGTPTLTSAQDTSPTTATATASPPPNTTYPLVRLLAMSCG